MASREFIHPKSARQPRSAEKIQKALGGPGFDYPATLVGSSGTVTVYYDQDLGGQGQALANQLLARVTAPFQQMSTYFGVPGGAANVVIAPLSKNLDGTGGAYHYGCDFVAGGTMYLDATFNSGDPLSFAVGLYIAELSECFMGMQGAGWNCGYSNGEGLSRLLAELGTPPGTLNCFASGPDWANAGFPDWVTNSDQTDQSPVSTGCAVVYLYWLLTRGRTLPEIVRAGGTSLADNYQSLGLGANAYQDLLSAVRGLRVTSDNPFAAQP